MTCGGGGGGTGKPSDVALCSEAADEWRAGGRGLDPGSADRRSRAPLPEDVAVVDVADGVVAAVDESGNPAGDDAAESGSVGSPSGTVGWSGSGSTGGAALTAGAGTG